MTMQQAKRTRLDAAGWKTGTAADFLGLTPEEEAYIEMKIALAQQLKALRKHQHISQTQLAKLIHSSQSRVAKMEAGSASVSIDLLVKSLLALGASRKDLASAISNK